MSIKVYEGYQIPTYKISHFMDYVDNKCLDSIIDSTIELVENITEKGIDNYCDEVGLDRDDFSDIYLKVRAAFKMIREDMKSDYRGLADMYASIDFWIKGEVTYLIPRGEDWVYKEVDFLEDLDYVNEFSYWNNVDKLEGVEEEEWEERGVIWKDILKAYDTRRLNHCIFDIDIERYDYVLSEISEYFRGRGN